MGIAFLPRRPLSGVVPVTAKGDRLWASLFCLADPCGHSTEVMDRVGNARCITDDRYFLYNTRPAGRLWETDDVYTAARPDPLTC